MPPQTDRELRHSYKAILLALGFIIAVLIIMHAGAALFWDKTAHVSCLLHCISGLTLSAVLIVFVWRIYRPLVQIERALYIFETFGQDFSVNIDKHNSVYPIALSLNRIHDHIQESINREYKARMKQKDAEIHALQNQINPHFLYNTLDTIRSLALINDDEQVAEMTEALSTFFRYSIGKRGHIVRLEEELENINHYLAIQNYRFQNKVSYQVIIEGNREEILSCRIPKLLLQPIIENAVYHGIEPKVGPGSITVRIFTTAASLVIHIRDDGIGMEETELQAIRGVLRQEKHIEDRSDHPQGIGIALINIHQRIQLNYGEEYGIRVASTKDVGSEVELRIPIVYEYGKDAI